LKDDIFLIVNKDKPIAFLWTELHSLENIRVIIE